MLWRMECECASQPCQRKREYKEKSTQMTGGIHAKHSKNPGDLAAGRARLTPRWMTAPDNSGTPCHDLAQRKSDCLLFCRDTYMTIRLSLKPESRRKANLSLNNGSSRFKSKQGGSSHVAPVNSSTLWYKARRYQHHLVMMMI